MAGFEELPVTVLCSCADNSVLCSQPHRVCAVCGVSVSHVGSSHANDDNVYVYKLGAFYIRSVEMPIF